MIYGLSHKVLQASNHCRRNKVVHLNAFFCLYSSSESREEEDNDSLPFRWYENALPKIAKLSRQLENLDFIDGRLVNINDGLVIRDDRIEQKVLTLKSAVRLFVGCPSMQRKLNGCFGKSIEREEMVVNSLTTVSNFLNVSAQQRKHVRVTICPQVTQQRIWIGALKEVLRGLKFEMDSLVGDGSIDLMGQQILVNCLKFLADLENRESSSWMRPAPAKGVDLMTTAKWEDAFEMFNDLIACLKSGEVVPFHVAKLEIMKEGLAQIKEVFVDPGIGYREVKHQQNLVQKKLSKTLGHSSRCLFTLLLYYLYGYVRDIEVDLRGGIYGDHGEKRFCLCIGRILTSSKENMVRRGVKQLDRALGIFKFVWETAGMEGELELQGHIWCIGANESMFTYRGNTFFVHEISL